MSLAPRISRSSGVPVNRSHHCSRDAVADENLRDAVLVGELQQRLDGVLSIQNLDMGLRGARDGQIALQRLLIVGGYFGLADVSHRQVAVKTVGVALAARDHGPRHWPAA